MNNQTLRYIWNILRIPFVIIIILFVGLVIYRIPAAQERLKTQEVIRKIQNQKLTIADVLGQNLPPEPSPLLKDSTVEGVDANNNGIRDDVELAIFKLHPDSARIRAAELQYAMALQIYLKNVFNSETLIAAIHQDQRSSSCVNDTISKPDYLASNEIWNQYFATQNIRTKEVESLVLSTDSRRQKYQEIFRKYMTSYSTLKDSHCDVDYSSLPN